jgi:hypothetical protein
MFNSVVVGAPRKCPNRSCRAEFFQDSHKGFLPKSELEAYAVMRCPVCRDQFMVIQMLNMVYDYKASLPTRVLPKNEITIFSNEDGDHFRTELYADDNPLWHLYDGYFPGSTNNPIDTQYEDV